jgi:hypothetical protein
MKPNSKIFAFIVLLALFCCSINVNNAQAQACGNNKVFVCHKGTTICISVNAVPAHLAHGDFLGQCVPQPPQCSVNLGPDTSFCSNQGNLVLDAGSGFATYLWSDNSTGQTLTVTTSGTYWVQATDSNCVASDTINVTVFPSPTVNAGNDTTITPPDCATLFASITSGTPPFSITWSNGDTTQMITVCDTMTTTYTVTVTDANGCMTTDLVTVNVGNVPPPSCNVDLGNDTAFCSNMGGLLLDAGPGFNTYLWSDNSTGQTLFVTVGGTYWVQVTDSNCVASDTINVTVFNSPIVNAGNDTTITPPDCAILFASITGGTPPFSVMWSNADTTQMITVCNNITTVYIVTVTDANGCMSTDTVTVNVTNAPPPCNVDLGNDTAFCSNMGGLLLDAGAGFNTYLWSNNSTGQTLLVNSSGTYWVEVTDSNCVASDTINVTVFNSPLVNAGTDTTISPSDCATLIGSITGGTPPFSVMWSNGDTTLIITVCDTSTTVYLLTVIDANGCSSSDTVTVTVGPPAPPCSVNLGNDTAFCDYGELLLDAGPGFATYLWSDSSTAQTLFVNTTGTYWVQVTDSNCVASDTINVTVHPSPTVNGGNDTTIVAPGCATLFASATGGTPPYSFLWSNGDTTLMIIVCDTISTTYTLSVTDANGCTSEDEITVTVAPPCSIDLGPDMTLCSGEGPFALDAGPGYISYLWSDSSITQSIFITASGTYWVQVVDVNTCVATDTINVTINPSPVVSAGNDTTITEPDCADLFGSATGGTPPYSFLWNNGDTTQAITVCDTESTIHILIVTDAAGCTGTDSVMVTVIPMALINLDPNPNSERITFVTSAPGNASLELYDMTGKLIAVLFKDYVQGNVPYRINFSGKDLPSGIYLVRLYTDNVNAANSKMILMR